MSHRRRRRARHAARRPLRRILLLLTLGLAVGAGATALAASPLLHPTHPASKPDLAAADLDRQRASAPDEASRDMARPVPSQSPSASPVPPPPSRPPAPVAGLSQAQTLNAATIVEVARERGLPRQAAVVAIATALQESGLHNVASSAVPQSLRYPHEGIEVDSDSVGLFQQRPSQGWGTVAQLMDPRYSTGMFYAALVKVSGWQSLSVTEAAQAVQRSAFPDAYQKHESTARQAVVALWP